MTRQLAARPADHPDVRPQTFAEVHPYMVIGPKDLIRHYSNMWCAAHSVIKGDAERVIDPQGKEFDRFECELFMAGAPAYRHQAIQ